MPAPDYPSASSMPRLLPTHFRQALCPPQSAVPTAPVDRKLLLPEEQRRWHKSPCCFSGEEARYKKT